MDVEQVPVRGANAPGDGTLSCAAQDKPERQRAFIGRTEAVRGQAEYEPASRVRMG